jgi:hypothetical protein
MHNEAVTELDHAVSAPHASFKVCPSLPPSLPPSLLLSFMY